MLIDLEKVSNIKFYENPSNRRRVVHADSLAQRQNEEANSRFSQFSQHV